MSLGERCWENDYSFVWLSRRFPCFLFEGIIVILDVEGVIPIWHPDHETSSEMLGAFDFYQDVFRERCGIYFNHEGEICLDLAWNKMRTDLGRTNGGSKYQIYIAKQKKPETPSGSISEDNTPPEDIPTDVLDPIPVEGNGEPEAVEAPANEEVPAASAPPEATEEAMTEYISQRRLMKSLSHLLYHSPPIAGCPGCMARTKAKKHFKGAFCREDDKHQHEITMDQVTMTDFLGTLGLDNYRYGVVFFHVQGPFAHFVPLRSLALSEIDRFFREFSRVFKDAWPFWDEDYVSRLVVYCDSHRTLISLCDLHRLPRKHPPPGSKNKCPVIERKINHVLAGIRAYLASGSLPMCFWPYAGECFTFNDNLKIRIDSEGNSFVPYTRVVGEKFPGQQFVTGQLVMYKPAPTVLKLPKVGDRLRPGRFLKYFTCGGNGKDNISLLTLKILLIRTFTMR